MRPSSQDTPARHGALYLRSAPLRAFTLAELIVVILIMGIFAAVAVPTFVDSLIFHRVESAARRFKADLELARQTARLTSTSQKLTVIGDTYDITTATDLNRATQPYRVDLSKPPYKVRLSANFDGNTDISYNGYGFPNRGGTVTLHSGDFRCELELDGTTGEITLTSNHSGGGTAEVAGN